MGNRRGDVMTTRQALARWGHPTVPTTCVCVDCGAPVTDNDLCQRCETDSWQPMDDHCTCRWGPGEHGEGEVVEECGWCRWEDR